MKAVVLESFGNVSCLKFKEVEKPEPKKGEVRIQIKASGFNPVDFKMRQGAFGGELPIILGCDCSGVIDRIDSETQGFQIGEEVYAMCFGQGSNGSYAEYLCISSDFVARKPKNISFEQAAVIPLASMTAYRAMISSGALKKGDSIFIAGAAGGVGSLAVQIARSVGVKTIYTIAGSEASAECLQREIGLKKDNILLYQNLSCDEMVEKLVAMNGGHFFDATFDFVGGEMKRLCLKTTGHSGHFATIVPENDPFNFSVWERGTSLTFSRNLSLHFVFVGSEAFSRIPSSWGVYSRQLNHISQLIEKGDLRPPMIKIMGDLSAESVVAAHHLLEEGRVKGKLVMKISS